MEPLLVLILLPLLIGVAAEVLFRDTLRASLAAALLAPVLVFLCITTLDPNGSWNWLASLLFAPLAMALALAAVMVCFGRIHARRHSRGRDA
jgi:membrane protein required for beta-lactamase induction